MISRNAKIDANVSFEMDSAWAQRLQLSGMGTFEDLMRAEGQRMILHRARSETHRVQLSDGQVAYVKRSLATRPLEIGKALLGGRKPQPGTHNECRACEQIGALGIATPRIIAEGQRRRGGLPWQGVFVALPLPGRPLGEFIREEPAEKVSLAMRNIVTAWTRIMEVGLCWPDLHLRHVHVLDDGQIGLLDLERVHRRNFLHCPAHRRKNVARLIKQATEGGAAPQCIQAFVEALKAAGISSGLS
ncbi:MAG: lipopolysaccharide kinase InaA family protein [Phycisphaerae bacterium]